MMGIWGKRGGGGAAREYVVGKEHATKNSKAFLRWHALAKKKRLFQCYHYSEVILLEMSDWHLAPNYIFACTKWL